MDKEVINYVNQKNSGKQTFCEMLFSLIDEKNLSDVEVYKRANLDRKYFSKLRSNMNYKPKKKIVCALALALELDNVTCKKLVKKAGYILTSASKFDLVIRYCIENKIYDLMKVNEILYDMGLDTI
jgi:hypothetical protein